jgi:hypothetical protein
VNSELRSIWEKATGYDPTAAKRLEEIDAKVANIRKAVEEGLGDASWANGRLIELKAERDRIGNKGAVEHEPPQIDSEAMLSFAKQTTHVLKHGSMPEKKRCVRDWVKEMKMAPEERMVHITYRIPEPFLNNMVAGAGFEPAIFRL